MIKIKIEENIVILGTNVVFIFTEKWHNNSIDKKGSAELSFLFLKKKKKEVADAQEQSFNNNIKESKATVKIKDEKIFFNNNRRKTK